jgi:hypothetical protein
MAGGCRMVSSGSGQRLVEGFCEDHNELSGSVIGSELLSMWVTFRLWRRTLFHWVNFGVRKWTGFIRSRKGSIRAFSCTWQLTFMFHKSQGTSWSCITFSRTLLHINNNAASSSSSSNKYGYNKTYMLPLMQQSPPDMYCLFLKC